MRSRGVGNRLGRVVLAIGAAALVGSLAMAPAVSAAESTDTGPARPQLPEPIMQAGEPGSDTGPARPQLPEPVDAAGAPSQPAAAPTAAPTAPLPTDMPNTGAFSVPALLAGIAALVLGLWCVLYARRGPRELALVEARTNS